MTVENLDIERLNAEFAIGERLRIVTGKGGFPVVAVDTPAARALVSVYGGQVLSFCPAGQAEDALFVSERAFFAPGKAIKGGIPVCWPWFGPDAEGKGRPAHGFARTRPWSLRGTEALDDGRILIRLGFADDGETRALWPHAFDLEVRVTVGPTLHTALVTRNTGTEPFTVTQALHSYFRVGDIDRVRLLGLEGTPFIDKTDSDAEKVQHGPLAIDREVDRIHTRVPPTLTIEDPSLGRRIAITAGGSASAVVWNPWTAIARAMADLDDGDYRIMLCVETANAGPDVVRVPPGGSHTLGAEISLEAL